jgi:type II secretory pathway component PulF
VFYRIARLFLIAIAVMLAIAYFAILARAVYYGFGTQVVLFGFVISVVLGAIVTVVSGLKQSRRSWAVLSSLEQAVRLNMPLPKMVRAIGAGDLGRGKFSRDMLLAADSIEHGVPVACVLSALPRMPQRIIDLVAAAERVGRLPQVLTRLVEQRRSAISRSLASRSFDFVYPLLLFPIFVGVLSFLVVKVLPKFEQICRDFGIPLPVLTRSLLAFTRNGGALAVMLVPLALLVLLLSGIVWHWQGPNLGLVERPGAWLANRLPWIGGMRRNRALGEMLTFTADAVEGGRPITVSLAEAAQACADSGLRRMLQTWVEGISRGQPIASAAHSAGLPPLVCGMVATAVQTPDLAPVLHFLGRHYTARFSRALTLLQASMVPVMAILMGLFVAWLALCILGPMIALVQTVSVPVR